MCAPVIHTVTGDRMTDIADAYSIDQFAARHGISRRQAYLEIAAGRLAARKVNSRTIVTREDAATWRQSLPRMSAATATA